MQDSIPFDEAEEKLNSLARLEEGWSGCPEDELYHSGPSPVPDKTAIDLARRVIASSERVSLPLEDIDADALGGITFSWRRHRRHAQVACFNGTTASVIVVLDEEGNASQSTTSRPVDPDEAGRIVLDFLGRGA